MKASELREKSVDELKATILELREKQFKLRMQQAAGEFNKTHELTALRKDVARVKTVLNEIQGK